MYKVNLLPEYLQLRNSHEPIQKLVWVGGVAILVCSILFFYGLFYHHLNSDQQKLAQKSQELADLKPRLQEVQKQQTQAKQQQEKYNQLATIVKNRLTWHSLLEDLPLALPVDTWIKRIEIKKLERLPSSGGLVSSGFKPPEKPKEKSSKPQEQPKSPPVPNIISLHGNCWAMGSVGVLVDNLSQLPYFEYVKLVDVHYERPQGTIMFELVAKIKGGAWDDQQVSASQP